MEEWKCTYCDCIDEQEGYCKASLINKPIKCLEAEQRMKNKKGVQQKYLKNDIRRI